MRAGNTRQVACCLPGLLSNDELTVQQVPIVMRAPTLQATMVVRAPARVLLADDQQKVRSALRLLIEQESAFCVVAEAQGAEEMLRQLVHASPDIMLLDWELPGLPTDGHKLEAVRALAPRLRVIALSGKPEAHQEALREGVDYFVSKSEPPEVLLKALYSVRDKAYDAHRQPAQPDRAV